MHEVGVIGVGLTRFTKHAASMKELVEAAVERALEDSDCSLRDVNVIFAGSGYAEVNGNGQQALRDLPTRGTPIVNVENACASGVSGLQEAVAWLRAGMADVALVIGMDKTSWVTGPLPMPEGRWYFDLGLMTPTWYGLQASAYLERYGLQPGDLGLVSVKSRRLGALNPYAHFQSEVTHEQVMSSRVIASPFTLHQCCPKTDGAGALVVATRAHIERKGCKAVWIRGSRMMSGQPAFADHAADDRGTAEQVARAVLEATSIEPSDLSVLEVHDAFTIGEFIYSEAMGICKPGGYLEYLKQGRSMPAGGGVAVNPGGGLLSRGHPIGATGIAQVAEVVWQLRGSAGSRQVPGARLGATLTMGAFEWERDTNVAIAFIFESIAGAC